MIEHTDIMTTVSFDEPEGDAERMFAEACWRLASLYPGTSVRYSLSPRGAMFVWDPRHGLVLNAAIRANPGPPVIEVYAMTACQPHGYEQATLLFASEIGRFLHNQHRSGGRRRTCSAKAEMCHKYRRLAKES